MMSRTFIWAVILIVACIALVLVISMPKTPVSADTSSTDYKPMTDFLGRLNKLLAEDDVAKNYLPMSEIDDKDLSWLLKDDRDVVKSMKGFRFTNKDVLIVFIIQSGKKINSVHIMNELDEDNTVIEKYRVVPINDKNNYYFPRETYVNFYGDFGCITNSDYYSGIDQIVEDAIKG